jgi:hypothetical protein
MGNEMKWPSGITSLQQQFQQQYRKQKSSVINDPDDENFCEDCPETEVYLPNSKSNPIKRIETLVHVSVAGQKLQSIVLMTLITPNKRLRMD